MLQWYPLFFWHCSTKRKYTQYFGTHLVYQWTVKTGQWCELSDMTWWSQSEYTVRWQKVTRNFKNSHLSFASAHKMMKNGTTRTETMAITAMDSTSMLTNEPLGYISDAVEISWLKQWLVSLSLSNRLLQYICKGENVCFTIPQFPANLDQVYICKVQANKIAR